MHLSASSLLDTSISQADPLQSLPPFIYWQMKTGSRVCREENKRSGGIWIMGCGKSCKSSIRTGLQSLVSYIPLQKEKKKKKSIFSDQTENYEAYLEFFPL